MRPNFKNLYDVKDCKGKHRKRSQPYQNSRGDVLGDEMQSKRRSADSIPWPCHPSQMRANAMFQCEESSHVSSGLEETLLRPSFYFEGDDTMCPPLGVEGDMLPVSYRT